MDTAYISAQDLAVGYNGRAVLEHINLEVRRGEILTLIGPNGAGKSTILRSLIAQLKLIAGTVTLDGQSLAQMDEKAVAKRLSVVMTDRLRPELMTCRDVVSTGRYPYTGHLGVLSRHDWEVVDEAMKLVHAQELANRPFDKISDGQRQRLLLARAVCQEPEIIILDEPTSFLDVRHKLELLSILKQMVQERNVAVIMSLHELDLAQRISDRVVCVSPRGIECQGSPEAVFDGSRISEIYGITKGTFYAPYGSVELEKIQGEPEVFVIGGGGSGIGVYRALQRRGIPFAAGVLTENDLDYPVAAALAVRVIAAPAFSPVEDTHIAEALKCMAGCKKVICTLKGFGPVNEKNRQLLKAAGEKLADSVD